MFVKNVSLGKKITFFGSFVVTMCVAITAFACLWQIRNDFITKANTDLNNRLKVFWELIVSKDSNLAHTTMKLEEKIKAADFKIQDEKLLVSLYALNGDQQIVDSIKDLFGGTATIFMRDERVSTNVLKNDGARALGTKLQGPAYEAVMKKGVSYRGQVDILGKPYFSAYDPIKNKAGEVVGVLYVGVPKSDYFATLYHLMIVTGIIAIALITVVNLLSIALIRRFMKPIVQLVPIANRLAEGDLDIRIEKGGTDEIGQVLEAMGNMVEKWRSVVAGVKQASDSIASAGNQLNTNAAQMSHVSSDQAKRAQVVASSAEEMSQTVLDVTKNISIIAASATETLRVAKEGEEIVGKSVTEVLEIATTVDASADFVKSLGERSAHIGEIVNVINDIADQTNLLALNAAIEAARAGDQGRGFAVVADEVRKLAERTAHSTSEIGAMIKAIQNEVAKAVDSMETATNKVTAGVELAEHAGESLKAIVIKADDLQVMVEQIASATEQMSATSDEISKDIEQIASASRETSASTEQTAQAALELTRLSENLQTTMGEFKLVT